ncbi:MAG: zinc-ribbon domain-containing protein [Fimbriiglobus sp.]
MSEAWNCQNCGSEIVLPEGFSRPKIRCSGCGHYSSTPKNEPPPKKIDPRPQSKDGPKRKSAEPEEVILEEIEDLTPTEAAARAAKTAPRKTLLPRLDPRDTRPNFEPDEPSGVPLLEGTQDEDDDKPYAVPGTGLKPCKHCGEDLPLNAEFCVHCGKSLVSKAKVDRVHQPMQGFWEEGFPLQTRYYIFAGMQVLNFIGSILMLLEQRGSLTSIGTWASLLFFQFFHIGLQAFIVGTYEAFSVKRNSKGQATMMRHRRIAFYPLTPTKISWKGATNVGIIGSHNPGYAAWFLCGYLCLFCLLPGALFYWFVIRPARFELVTCDVYGVTEETLFRTTDREALEVTADFVRDATGLHDKKVM